MSGNYFINEGLIKARIEKAEKAALREYGDMVVKRARAKAPVRKLLKGKRTKYKLASKLGNSYLAAAFEHRRRMGFKSQQEANAYATYLRKYARVKVQRRGVKRQAITLGRPIKKKSSNTRKVGGGGKMFISPRGKKRGQIQNLPGAQALVRMAPENRFRNARGIQGRLVSGARTFGRFESGSSPFVPEGQFDESLTGRGRYEVKSGRASFINDETGRLQVGGRLKASILRHAPERKGNKTVMKIAAEVPYAIYVEFPTSHNAAQPFLLPALHESKRQLPGLVERELRKQGLKKG